jgi:hypothetical protein
MPDADTIFYLNQRRARDYWGTAEPTLPSPSVCNRSEVNGKQKLETIYSELTAKPELAAARKFREKFGTLWYGGLEMDRK